MDQDVSLPVSQRPTVGLSKPSGQSSGPAAAECVDVGLFVKDCESEQEVAQKLQELPQEKKYALLTQHKRPPQGFQFPITFVGGCNRSFRPSWLSDHRWLAYSTQLDGAFCVPCALFNGSGVKGRLQLGKLVTRPFQAWQKCQRSSLNISRQSTIRRAWNLRTTSSGGLSTPNKRCRCCWIRGEQRTLKKTEQSLSHWQGPFFSVEDSLAVGLHNSGDLV